MLPVMVPCASEASIHDEKASCVRAWDWGTGMSETKKWGAEADLVESWCWPWLYGVVLVMPTSMLM